VIALVDLVERTAVARNESRTADANAAIVLPRFTSLIVSGYSISYPCNGVRVPVFL